MFEDNGNQTEQMGIDNDILLPDGFEEGMTSFDELKETEESTEVVENDEESVDNEEQTEESEESKEESEETEEQEQKEFKLSEYLGKEELKHLSDKLKVDDLTPEKVIELMQKGMDRDRINGKLEVSNELNHNLKTVSDLYGQTPESLVEVLLDNYFKSKSQEEGRHIDDVKKEFNQNRKTRNSMMLDRFIEKFPDIDVDSIPQEVTDATKAGEDLVSAYETHLKDIKINDLNTEIETLKGKISELEKANKVKTQNESVKKKSVVTKVSGSDDTSNDDFLSGLLD